MACNSPGAAVLRLVRVLTELLTTAVHVLGVSARLYQYPFISPFHLFLCSWERVLSSSLQIPSQFFGFVHLSSTSCFTHASGFSKALQLYIPSLHKGWLCIPSSRSENITLNGSYNKRMKKCSFTLLNKQCRAIGPEQLVNFSANAEIIFRFVYLYQRRAGLLLYVPILL